MAVNIGTLSGGTISTIALAAPLDANLRATTIRLFARMRAAMPWIPYDPSGLAIVAMDQGTYPYPDQTIVNPPAWVNDVNRMNAWHEMAGQFVPLTQLILTGQQAQAAAAGAALDRNTAFWNDVALYSGADAVQKVWDGLWNAIASFKAQRDAAVVAITVAKSILATNGAHLPASFANQTAALDAQVASLSNRAAAALAPLGAAGKSAAGLGAAGLVIAGIAAAVVVTITTSIAAIAYEMASVQKQANANAQQLLMANNAVDNADYAAGKITNEQLMARRGQNAQDAIKLVDAEGAAAIGSSIGRAGLGVALGVGALAAVAFGAYLLLTRKKAS